VPSKTVYSFSSTCVAPHLSWWTNTAFVDPHYCENVDAARSAVVHGGMHLLDAEEDRHIHTIRLIRSYPKRPSPDWFFEYVFLLEP